MRDSWLIRQFTLLLLLGTFGVMASLAVDESNAQQNGSSKPKGAVETPVAAPDVMADIDDAIKTLEKKDFQRFFERYMPAELLRSTRQQNQTDVFIRGLSERPRASEQMMGVLKAIRKLKPTFDDSHGLATFRYDMSADAPKADRPDEVKPRDTTDVNLTGLGDDLKTVLVEGEKLLVDNQIQKFIECLFPAPALARLKQPDTMQAMVFQFSASGEAPKPARGTKAQKQIQRPPTLLEAMRDDFKLLQTFKPEMLEQGQLAVYHIPATDDRPERLIQFQKVGSHWRFFDDSDQVVAELGHQSALRPAAEFVEVQMELIGGNWRFGDLKMLQNLH